jgi:hypothetical protein
MQRATFGQASPIVHETSNDPNTMRDQDSGRTMSLEKRVWLAGFTLFATFVANRFWELPLP